MFKQNQEIKDILFPRLEDECSYYENINFGQKKYMIPLMLLHQTGIYTFIYVDQVDNFSLLQKYVFEFLQQIELNIQQSINKCHVILVLKGSNNALKFFLYENTNARVKALNSVLEYVLESFEWKKPILNQEDIDDIVLKIYSYSNQNNIIFENEEGKRLIKKNNLLLETSSQDSEELFYLTLFGGVFGLHKFHMKKYFSGILYVLTFGLFGVGWLFDVLRLLLGVAKDKQNKLILPLENRIQKILMTLVMGIFVVGYVILCIKLVSFIFAAVVNTTSSLAENEDVIRFFNEN